MTNPALRELLRAAEARGIQTHYKDMSGGVRQASEETLERMIELLGEVEPDLVPPVVVQWDQRPLHVRVGGKDRRVPAFPYGYHQIDLARNGGKTLLISAPTKFYSNPELSGAWGVFAPMYSLRSEGSWGSGNFSDWNRFCEWAGQHGARVVGTLPILAGFIDHPVCEPSPYSPASRLFWNEFYVDPQAAPEFEKCPEAKRLAASSVFQREISRVRAADYVDYPAEWKLKRAILELLAEQFFGKRTTLRRHALRQLLRERPQLADYAVFRALCDRHKKSWHTWPARLKEGQVRLADYPQDSFKFHLYLQFLAHEQVEAILKRCEQRNVHFYLDLPLGVNPDSYDLWRYREFFAHGASTGAPPDMFFTKGQDWGFSPPHPHRMRQLHYGYFIEYIRHQMRHTGLLRIDHVMGLQRLFWIPHGLPASEGAFVSYPAEELYAILSLESHLNQTMVAGENLGTVPPEVNRGMKRHHLRGMYVLQYEQRENGKPILPAPPREVVASLNTHDMPPFAAYLQGLDIDDRADLGLIPQKDLKKERARRKKMIQQLSRFLQKLPRNSSEGRLRDFEMLLPLIMQSDVPPQQKRLLRSALEFLLQSKAEIVLLNMEDLWGETRPQNVPGTSAERPNWRRKWKLTLEDLERSR
jgi:4-alpha-glucanotransferase